MLQPGDRIPDVTLFDTDVRPVRLPEFVTEGPLLLAFYLYDWTGTWRSELRLLRDRSAVFGVAGVRIAAVSRDSPYSHKKYAEQQWLDYPLLSDWSGEAVRAFGVAQDLDGLLDSPVRSCFLIDRDGVIRHAWRYGDDEVPDVEELARAAVSLTNG